MRTSTLLLPLLVILANDVRCKDEEPKGAEFGEPCGEIDTPCADGLECYIGYCAEKCTEDSDCQPVEGYQHKCETDGLCHIYCDADTLACPQNLGTPLQCGVIWCSGES